MKARVISPRVPPNRPAYSSCVPDPMLCALLDLIEDLVRDIRSADLTRDRAAHSWYLSKQIPLPQAAQGPVDFVVADAANQSQLEEMIAPDGLALVRVGAKEDGLEFGEQWERLAHVVSGQFHWQLWRQNP